MKKIVYSFDDDGYIIMDECTKYELLPKTAWEICMGLFLDDIRTANKHYRHVMNMTNKNIHKINKT